MRTLLCVAVLSLLASSCVVAQQFAVPIATFTDSTVLSTTMPELAKQVLAAYHEEDRQKYLDNVFRLQMVAGKYKEAAEAIAALRELRAPTIPGGGDWVNIQYEIFANAKVREAEEKTSLVDAYKAVFRATMRRLDDPTSFLAIRSFGASWVANALKADLRKLKGKDSLVLTEALQLIHDYQASKSYSTFTPLAKPLIEEDDSRRYIVTPETPVKLLNGATICIMVIRPRAATRLPVLLTYTIYADNSVTNLAKMAAAYGYVGIVGLTRGKKCSPDTTVPYRDDGADAAALIDWIGSQPWSDGQVGMYGGSYSGFTAWATAKHMAKALKAIAVGAAAAPGIDVPMEGNVFWNFLYPWPFYTTDNKGLDDSTYNQYERWNKLNHDWYVSGRAYHDLDKIDGKPNPVFNDWISHPSYDAYWQSMIPFGKEFANIKIPVLQTAGYYYGGPGAAVYYFSEHIKHNPQANHFLVIGPYQHFGAQIGVVSLIGDVFPSLAGMNLDPVALINIEALRFQFFDHVLKNAPRPELLKDRVNYEVTGANLWKHASSLSAMAGSTLRFYLSATRVGDAYRLSEKRESGNESIELKVDLADRSDVDRNAQGGGVLDKEIDAHNGIMFVSDSLARATEMSGLFSGRLDFMTNKKDFDFEIDLYELTPNGEYVQLAPYWARASYVGDPVNRHLLEPGKRHRLAFQSRRLMSRQLQPGSRVVAVIRVIKEPGRQINYGTGKDVSNETIKDANGSLSLKWFNDSYLELPVGR